MGAVPLKLLEEHLYSDVRERLQAFKIFSLHLAQDERLLKLLY
jgi:hypothetical protein